MLIQCQLEIQSNCIISKHNRFLTCYGEGIAGNKLKCNPFSALVLGTQLLGAGGFFPID